MAAGETHDPDWSREKTQVDAAQAGVDSFDDHGTVVLDANANADDPKIHDQEGPQAPVHEDVKEVAKGPLRAMIDSLQIMVVDFSVATCQCRTAPWKPTQVLLSGCLLARCSWSIGKPPEEDDTNSDGDDAINQEHPLEADQTLITVHLLKTCGDQTDDSGRNLRSGVVLTDALSGSRRRIEESEVVGHSRPHAGNDNTQ